MQDFIRDFITRIVEDVRNNDLSDNNLINKYTTELDALIKESIDELIVLLRTRDGGNHDQDCKIHYKKICNCGHSEVMIELNRYKKTADEEADGEIIRCELLYLIGEVEGLQKSERIKIQLETDVSLPTIADERYLKDCISFPIANKFKTHPESIPDVVAEIYTALKEKFEFIRRKATIEKRLEKIDATTVDLDALVRQKIAITKIKTIANDIYYDLVSSNHSTHDEWSASSINLKTILTLIESNFTA